MRRIVLVVLSVLLLSAAGVGLDRDARASGPSSVLIVVSDGASAAAPVKAKLLSDGIAVVDVDSRCGGSAPALSTLQQYDVVMAWTNCGLSTSNAIAWGDVLADYVDGGGSVVLSTFSWFGTPFDIEGRVSGPGYSPFDWNGNSLYSWSSLGAYDAGHPIMAGVSSVSAFYRDRVTVDPGATLVASWADGAPFVGVNTSCNVAGVNAYAGFSWTGDLMKVFSNAVHHVYEGCGPTIVSIDIKPGSFPNSINLKSKGVIPVAIFTTETFDATTVDGSTVTFAGAATAHGDEHLEDVDGDGDLDWVGHFETQSTTIGQSDTEACLDGQTSGGEAFHGCDSVRIVSK